MSIQTELTRITNAKTAIKTAIEGKGVTVPDGTLLDGMASLIEGIEAGGGGVTYGTITIAEENTPYTIAHGLGVKPSILLFVFLPDDSFSKIIPICTSIVGKYGAGEISVTGNGTYGKAFESLYFGTQKSSIIKNYWNSTTMFGGYLGFQMVNDKTFTLNAQIGIRTYLWVAIA